MGVVKTRSRLTMANRPNCLQTRTKLSKFCSLGSWINFISCPSHMPKVLGTSMCRRRGWSPHPSVHRTNRPQVSPGVGLAQGPAALGQIGLQGLQEVLLELQLAPVPGDGHDETLGPPVRPGEVGVVKSRTARVWGGSSRT